MRQPSHLPETHSHSIGHLDVAPGVDRTVHAASKFFEESTVRGKLAPRSRRADVSGTGRRRQPHPVSIGEKFRDGVEDNAHVFDVATVRYRVIDHGTEKRPDRFRVLADVRASVGGDSHRATHPRSHFPNSTARMTTGSTITTEAGNTSHQHLDTCEAT